jgi:hypothetical protein
MDEPAREWVHFTLFVIILLTFVTPTTGDDLPGGSLSGSWGFATISSPDDAKKLIDESNLSLNEILFSKMVPKKERLAVIGEIALSWAEKDLVKLSNNLSMNLSESKEFTRLYSGMSYSFGMNRIPIKLSDYRSLEEQITEGKRPSAEIARNNGSDNEQVELIPPSLHIFEIRDGNRESAGGVELIWDSRDI